MLSKMSKTNNYMISFICGILKKKRMYKAMYTFTIYSKTKTDSQILRTNQWFPVGRRKGVQYRGRRLRGANYMHKIYKKSGYTEGLQVVLVVENQPAKRCRLDPWVGRIPCGREWQPTPVFLSEESHGQRSLAGYCL